ncbi:MAG: alginate lyase family protein, partial [Acidobacteria bacterium]|nr:alginate lyase family protein [Acidobacteriota bacterium]
MSLGFEKLRRLSEMSGPELRFRLAQQLRIARERRRPSPNGKPSDSNVWLRAWDADKIQYPALVEAIAAGRAEQAAHLLPDYFASRKSPVFFFDSNRREELGIVHEQFFPERKKQLRDEAEMACAHRFHIFAYPEVDAGAEIPWRRDLVHGKESWLEHWSRIAYLDFEKCGDSKIVWEPNRHQHFVTLGQAYFLTGEERFAEEILAQRSHWERENPHLYGINWASSLEVAFRSWSWLWAFEFIRGSRALTGARMATWSLSFAQHAEYIAQNLSTYFSPNTHLLGEGFALFAMGTMLPELRGANGWRETGRRILLEQMEKQVRADGTHLEQSSYYHLYATDFFLSAAILAAKNDAPFPATYRARLEEMVEFLLHLKLPSGRLPMIGDADGGRLLALARFVPNDCAVTLSVAADFFDRADFRAAAGRAHEESFWLNGIPSAGQEVNKPESVESASREFRDGRFVIQSADSGNHAHKLIFDAGPQGMPGSAHGHADALSIICSAEGVDWLIDSGTFVYTSSRQWRDFFRGTRAHNTVVVDGQDQAVPVDFFKWRELPEVCLERAIHTRALDFAVASHKGYTRLPQPVIHRRSVVFIKPEYWIISDEFLGKGEHALETLFHFSPRTKLEQRHGDWLATNRNSRFLLVPPLCSGLEVRVVSGEETPIQGWYSEDYGHRTPAPVLEAKSRVKLPARFHWLLWPGAAAWPKVHESSSKHLNVRIETEVWDDFVATRNPDDVRESEFTTDAELAFLRRGKNGALLSMAIIGGCC